MRSGTGFNVLSSAIRVGGRGLWSLAIPALLSVDDFAVFSLWQTTAVLLAYLGVLGTPQLIMREPRHSVPVVGLLLHASVLVLAGLGVVYLITPVDSGVFYAAVLGGALATACSLVLNARAKAMLSFSSVAISEACSAALLLAVGVPLLLLLRGRGLEDEWRVASVVEIGAVVPVLLLLGTGRFQLGARERRLHGTVASLKAVYSIGILVAIDVLLWRRLELYFLAPQADGMRSIAAFSLATQLGGLFMVVPSAVVEAWYPSVAQAYREGGEAFDRLWRSRIPGYALGYLALTLVCVPVFIGFVHFFFSKYEWALVPMSLLVLIRVATGYVGIYSSMLYASGNERWLYPNVIVGSVCAIAGNAILTVSMGLWGAVLAYAITQGAVAVVTLLVWGRSRR